MNRAAAPDHAGIVPRSLAEAPALIERLLPVQKLSAEAYKEQMAVHGKTLTALGSYWKGRKPLILAKACVMGCLLPATEDAKRDLEIFEMLMGMDDLSFAARAKRRPKPKEILATLSLTRLRDYFEVKPDDVPAVIALGQRPGPATGLPTRTAQGDLNLARHAGHGHFARILLAPKNIPDAFEVTARAFDLAERFQCPVFVMTDQHINDSSISCVRDMPGTRATPFSRAHAKSAPMDTPTISSLGHICQKYFTPTDTPILPSLTSTNPRLSGSADFPRPSDTFRTACPPR